jgi:hypothetical protein
LNFFHNLFLYVTVLSFNQTSQGTSKVVLSFDDITVDREETLASIQGEADVWFQLVTISVVIVSRGRQR